MADSKKLPQWASSRRKNISHVRDFALPEDLLAREYASSGPGTKRPVADQLLGDIGVLWYLLRVLGMVPVGISSSGEADFRLLSLPMLYSVLVYLLMACSSCYLVYDKLMNVAAPESDIYNMVFKAIQIVYLLVPIIFAPLHWLQAGQLAKNMVQWQDFQANFSRVTGKLLQFSLKSKTNWIALMIVVLTAALAFSEYFLLGVPTVRMEDIPIYAYAFLLFLLHLHLWCALCQALVTSARQLMAAIASEVVLTPALVVEYSALWLQLATLTEGVGHSLGLSLGDFLLSTFVHIAMSAYGALYGIVHGLYLILGAFLLLLACASFQVLLLCAAADEATNEVGDTVLHKLRQVSSINRETQKELTLFLHIVASDRPAISLAGFVMVRRRLLATLLSTTTSYLIVLMQFEGSGYPEIAKTNATGATNHGRGGNLLWTLIVFHPQVTAEDGHISASFSFIAAVTCGDYFSLRRVENADYWSLLRERIFIR